MSEPKLSLYQSIPIGIGSIIGSGILFLPSLTYFKSESNVVIAWVLTTLICLPGVIFFRDMAKASKENSGMAGFVELGLGEFAGNCVYTLLLGTVIFGMPSAAIIAGDYIKYVFNYNYIDIFTAYFLIILSILINLKGLVSTAKLSGVISIFLIIISIYLFGVTSLEIESYDEIKPNFDLMQTYGGIVLAFWAFAGFENLTFLYSKFKNPERDLTITLIVSIVTCSLIYLGLVVNYASLIPHGKIENTVGLLQISKIVGGKELPTLISAFALLAVAINLISWTSGVSELINQSSKKGLLPSFLTTGKNEKRKCTLFLGTLFLMNLSLALTFREGFLHILNTVSGNFLLIYILGLSSYAIYSKSKIKKVLSSLIAIFLSLTMTSSGYLLIYPVILIFISILATFRKKTEELI